jgi:hypothetical protein
VIVFIKIRISVYRIRLINISFGYIIHQIEYFVNTATSDCDVAKHSDRRADNSPEHKASYGDCYRAKLAKQLGLGKSSLFKAIDALNSSGAISFNGNAVCIKDEEKLKSFI